jgi:hypothetical protein
LRIEICNLPDIKTQTQVIADAFKTVSSDASHHGHWIQDSNYAAIICLEYDLQSDHLVTHDLLNKSLARDRQFKTADDCIFGNGAGTFRDMYKPKKLLDGFDNERGRICCYYVIDAGKLRPETKNGESCYETFKPFWLGPRPHAHLQILENCKSELQTLLLRTENASRPPTTPIKHVSQWLDTAV